MRVTACPPFLRPLLIASIALTLGLIGCGKEPLPPQPEPIQVLATTYALADVVRQVGGSRVAVEWFVESGQSLELLAETPERRNQFRNVNLVVTRGAADPWMLQGVGNQYQDARVLRVDGLLAARDADPSHHLWLDPQVAIELADEVARRLGAREPQSDGFFQSNASAFRRQVAAAADVVRPVLDASNGKFLTLDRAFLPVARRFGLTEVKPPGGIDLQDPTTYGAKALKQLAADAGVKAVFVNAETPVALRRDWESRLGLMVLPLDAVGSSAPDARSTYLAVLQYNLEQLSKGIGGTRTGAAPAPAAPATAPPR